MTRNEPPAPDITRAEAGALDDAGLTQHDLDLSTVVGIPPVTYMRRSGLFLPSRLHHEADEGGYRVRLTLDLHGWEYVCSSVTIEQLTDGPPVSGEALRRLTIAADIRAAVEKALLGQDSVLLDPPAEVVSGGMTDEAIRWVARLYELAELLHYPPTKTVQDRFGISRATAGRWVAEARRRGLLDPLEGGNDGKH